MNKSEPLSIEDCGSKFGTLIYAPKLKLYPSESAK